MSANSHTPFELPSELTIYAVGDLRSVLVEWLHMGDAPWQVNAAHLTEVDGAGIQLLGSVAQTLASQGQGHSLRIVNAPQALRRACDVLGCTSWFEWLDEGVTP